MMESYRRRGLLAGLAAAPLTLGALSRPALAAAPWPRAPYLPRNAEEWQVTTRDGRRYRVLVSWPFGEVPEEGWPSIFALDGNAMFPLLDGACRLLADSQQGVIVAIDFPLDEAVPDRRDFEYTLAGGETAQRHGGADLLLDSITEEIRPAVEAAFRLDPSRRALFGHSYGGLFALHALFARDAGFNTILAASPSIWWGNGVLVREAEAFRARVPAADAPRPRLLLTYGALEGRQPRPPGAPALPVRRIMGDNVRELAAQLGALEGRFAALEMQEFANENHGSVRAAAAGRAVPFAFAG